MFATGCVQVAWKIGAFQEFVHAHGTCGDYGRGVTRKKFFLAVFACGEKGNDNFGGWFDATNISGEILWFSRIDMDIRWYTVRSNMMHYAVDYSNR